MQVQDLTSRTRWRAATPLLVAAVGFLLTVLAAYPGWLNGDSQWQLEQARAGEYRDLHPPLMSFLWRYLDLLVPGAGGMFLFQAGLFWIGLALVAARLFPSTWMAWALPPLIGFYPPLFITLFMIVKDTLMMAAMVFAVGMMLDAATRSSKAAFLLGWVGLFCASSLRHNALLAAFPIALWAGWILCERILPETWRSRLARRSRRVAAGLVLFLCLPLAAALLQAWVLRATPDFPAQTTLLHDVVGISLESGTNYLPASYDREGREWTLEALRPLYDPHADYSLLFGDPPEGRPGFVHDRDHFSMLLGAWTAAVYSHPRLYLERRFEMFKAILGLQGSESYWPYWLPSQESLRQDRSFNAGFKRATVRVTEAIHTTFLYRAWFYGAILLLAMFAGWRGGSRAPRAFWSVAASALLYELGYFLIAPNHDFRYSWWTVVGAILVLPMLRRSPRSPSEESPADESQVPAPRPAKD